MTEANRELICINCHYSFSLHPEFRPCKCRLNLDPDRPVVKAMLLRQNAIGFREALIYLNKAQHLTNGDIEEIIMGQRAQLKAALDNIMESDNDRQTNG